ncbi:DUF5906 domain-containing protein [Chromatium okenii]|jgi:hypothetical protein|uniref:DUF5906 domain-containing protein n=1 Tax=Chromatium okenii TaxID=61644 RepID=UPI0026F03006|nr:DUF5906 domain-containing protein [Chromatium okenii]MBV5311552.1 hypothetical protein [Chromatium okenii]
MKHPLQLLRHLTNEAQHQYVLDWLAFAIQNNCTAKHATALVIHSPKGSGKTTFFQYFAEQVATRGMIVNYPDLSRVWTALNDANFLVIDGVPASALTENGNPFCSTWKDRCNHFDELICNQSLIVNKKHEPTRMVTNELNVVILVNDDELPPLPAFYTVITSDQKFDAWTQLNDEQDFPLLLSEYLEAIEINSYFNTIALPTIPAWERSIDPLAF